jgi:hypothetical protein
MRTRRPSTPPELLTLTLAEPLAERTSTVSQSSVRVRPEDKVSASEVALAVLMGRSYHEGTPALSGYVALGPDPHEP